jgi:hypothetical protein
MMDCVEIRDRIEALALRCLDADEARAIESHLAFCEACRARRAEIEELLGVLGRLAESEPARPGLEDRILARTAVPAAPRRRWRPASIAAAALLASAAWVAAGYQWGRYADMPGLHGAAARFETRPGASDDAPVFMTLFQHVDRRIARIQEQVERQGVQIEELRRQESRLAEIEKRNTEMRQDLNVHARRLADAVNQLGALRDQTLDLFLKVAGAVSGGLIRY